MTETTHSRRIEMRTFRLVLAGAAVLVVAGLSAVAAPAATSVSVSVKLVEALKAGPIGTQTCPDIGVDVNCGSGEVRPFGRATSIVSIGVCGENCSIRWITLSGGTIVLRESLSNVSCPGACVTEWPHGAPFRATSTAVVVGGTGDFAGASGDLSGSLAVAAWEAQITYSGTITLPS
jgi:hypothetical protein